MQLLFAFFFLIKLYSVPYQTICTNIINKSVKHCCLPIFQNSELIVFLLTFFSWIWCSQIFPLRQIIRIQIKLFIWLPITIYFSITKRQLKYQLANWYLNANSLYTYPPVLYIIYIMYRQKHFYSRQFFI